MQKEHIYSATITWTGNRGEGTASYKGYDRSHLIQIQNKKEIEGSSDVAFMGNPVLHSPEDLFLSSLSACHMLWFLHLCADNGIIVTEYVDVATAAMLQTNEGGYFTEVILHPAVTITDSKNIPKATMLHESANKHCYIANSCNFPVKHEPFFKVEKTGL